MTQSFTAPLDSGDSITIDQFTITATIRHDHDSDAPWDAEDGHGPVSDWRRASIRYGYASKRAGELLLCSDYGSARFYDYSTACKLALRDGWGYLPGSLQTFQTADGKWTARALCRFRTIQSETIGHDDINQAIRALYAKHRDTFPSARAYAAAAARADYDRLAAWCNAEWCYVGIVVTVTDTATGITLGDASLWGIESDAVDYLAECANELTQEALSDARNAIASLVNAASVTE